MRDQPTTSAGTTSSSPVESAPVAGASTQAPAISITTASPIPATATTSVATHATTTTTTTTNQAAVVDSTYHLKWIPWNSGKIPIVMQSKNGPCPLIATMNVLLLREKVKLPPMLEQITADQLLTYLGECIMDSMPAEIQNDENAILNLEQNIHDAIEILPKLNTGLDVNIRFTGITDFEYTPECIVFDLLRIPLYHGWLSDPSLEELRNAIGTQSYNQLVDNIITNKTSTDPEMMAKVLVAEEFLEGTASQLTEHGLNELKCQIKDNEIGILFRNNHFLTLFKREGDIYTLVTDHGYLTEDNIIWETLDNIEGAGRFFDSNFQPSEITNKQVSEFQAIDQRQKQLENDFLMALSLREEESSGNDMPVGTSAGSKQEDDFEFARRLQEEENRIYEEMRRENQAAANEDRRLVPVDNQPVSQPDVVAEPSGTQPPNSPEPTLADVNRRWAQVVSDGPAPSRAATLMEVQDVNPCNYQTSQPTNTTTQTTAQATTDWSYQPPAEPHHQQQQQLYPEQAPSGSSQSDVHTQPGSERQQPSRPRPQPSASRRGNRNDKNSKDANCVVN